MPKFLDLSDSWSVVAVFFWGIMSFIILLIPVGLLLYLFLSKDKGYDSKETRSMFKKFVLGSFLFFLFNAWSFYWSVFGFSQIESIGDSWYLYNVFGYRLAEITQSDNPQTSTREFMWTTGQRSAILYVKTDKKKYRSIVHSATLYL